MEPKNLKKIIRLLKKVNEEIDTLQELCKETPINVTKPIIFSCFLPDVREVLGGDLELREVGDSHEAYLTIDGVTIMDPYVPEWELENYG